MTDHPIIGVTRARVCTEITKESVTCVTRERLPQRREHELLEFEHAGIPYVAGIGRFADGRLAEIFLNAGKAGTAIETHARDAAITVSLLLQHGCASDTIRHALTRNRDGSAAGPLGTLLDALATADQKGNGHAESQ
jgi:ribonucleoside-diphosphate reductase alpha chain